MRLPSSSSASDDTPVTLPPGLARLGTIPALTGSPTGPTTMGIVVVARLAASAGAVPHGVKMRSTLPRTRSSASAASRSALPAASRYSKVTLRPSTWPRSRNAARNAASPGPSHVIRHRTPMRTGLPAGCAWTASGAETTASVRSAARSRRRRAAAPRLRLVRALVLVAEPLQLLAVQAHAQVQAHLAEDRLDLVERLLAEVLGLEQLRLAALDEIGDGPDVGGLQTVRGAHGQLELVDVAEQVLVQLDARPHLVLLGLLRLRHDVREVHEELEVILEDARGLADRGRGRHAAVGPQLEHQALVGVGQALDVEVDPLDRREVRVEQDGVDGQGFRLAPVGRDVAATALDADLHLEHPVLVEAGQRRVGREDLDVGVGLEVTRLHHAR